LQTKISPKRVLASLLYPRYFAFVDKLNRNPLFVQFVRENESAPCYDDRYKMYDHLIDQLGPAAIDYLEFGVWKGASIKYWSARNQHSDSRFVGFDTFTGLPEAWDFRPEGTFDVKGELPKIDDPRITFVAGLFQQTLPAFLSKFVLRNRLVLHLDADLYSATLYVLAKANHLIQPGTILIFDEFGDVQHEFRAYHDYVTSHLRECKVVCASYQYYTIAMEVTK
jgi:Methyltransferase domain